MSKINALRNAMQQPTNGGAKKKDRFQDAYDQGTRIYEQNRNQLVQQTQKLQGQLQTIGNGPLTYQQAKSVSQYYTNLQNLTNYGFDTSEPLKAIGDYARQNDDLLSKYKTEKDYNNSYLYPTRYQSMSGSANTMNQLNGLRRNIAALRQSGDKKKADALQSEYDWLNQHQYDYWSQDELGGKIKEYENRVSKNKDALATLNPSTGDLTVDNDPSSPGYSRRTRLANENASLESRLGVMKKAKEDNAYRDFMTDWGEKDYANMEELAALFGRKEDVQKTGNAAQLMTPGMNNPFLAVMTGQKADSEDGRIKELTKYFRDKGYTDEQISLLADYFLRNQHALQRQKDMEELAGWAKEHPWLSSLESIPTSLASGLGYVDLALQNANARTDTITGDKQRVDQYSALTGIGDVSSTIRGAVSEDMGAFANFLYQTGMSMGDFLAAAPTGGAAELMLGGAAAMQATREAYARGASDGQALAMGAWAGASEAIFEHLSLGNLRAMKTSATAARGVFRQILVDMAKQAGVEGSEELFTTISNTIGDAFIMADKSELNTAIRDYMEQNPNMSEADATARAYTDWANGAVMDFLGGALSGGLLGGGNRARMSWVQGVVGRSILEDESGGREFDLINEALTLPEGTEARTFAEQLAKTKLESGDYTASEIGQLAWAVDEYKQTAKKENNPTADMSRTHPVITEAADGSGATVMATQMSEIAESLVAAGDTHQEALAKTKVVEAVVAGDASLSGNQINKVGFSALTAPSTVEVIKQYTGVDITANGKTASAIRKSILAARDQQAERAAQIKAQGEAINAARSAVEAAVAQNDAEAGAKATAMLNEAQSAVDTGVRAQVPDTAAVEPGAPAGTAEAPVGDTTTAAAAASATPAAASDDTLHFSNGGSLTFKEFVEAFHDRNPDNPASKRELAQRFGELLDAQAQNGGTLPAKDLNSVVSSAASEKKVAGKTEAKPTGKAKTGDTTRGTTRGATKGKDKADLSGKARAELEASRNDRDATKKGKTVKVAEGVEFAAREGGLQELSNTQIWTGALVYRFLKNIGAKKVVFDAAYVGNANALIEPDGTIYINPEARGMDSRGSILWALGHEIMHPATDGSRAQNPFAEKVLGTFEKLAKMGALKDGKLLQQVSERTTVVNRTMAKYKKFYEQRGDTEMASRVDEHFASQEVAGDWMGAAFQSREIMELIGRVDPSTLKRMQRAVLRMQELITKIQRAQARKLTGGTGISIINPDADSAKEAAKIVRDLAKDVNAALQKSALNQSFKEKGKAKPKTKTKSTAAEATPSTRHMYLGENSKTADREALQIAQDFEKQGMNADQIRIVTGWFRGADGKWRYELADDRMTLRTKGTARLFNDSAEYREFSELETKERSGKLTEEERARYEELAATYVPLRTKVNKETRKRIREGTATLDDVLVHPELFEAYPELRQMRVRIANIGPSNLYGSYNPSENLLSLNSNANMTNPEMRRTIAHEVQHAVQRLAGTAKGANPSFWSFEKQNARRVANSSEAWLRDHAPEEYRKWKAWQTAFRDGDQQAMYDIETDIANNASTPMAAERFRSVIGAHQLARDRRSDFELYEDTVGEREARDTSARLERTADQRLRQRPDLGENPVFAETPYRRNPTKPPKGTTTTADGAEQRYSVSDEDYMAAVENGDMKTAQRMVDEAAKAAGYDIKAYHGTRSENFNVFDPSRSGENYGGYNAEGGGISFTRSEDWARRWGAKARGDGDIRVVPAYLKTQKTFYSYNGKVDPELRSELPDDLSESEKDVAMANGATFHKTLEDNGVNFKEAILRHGYDSYSMYPGADNIAVYDPAQVKSADPVTYDNDGNVIPLSERFDFGNPDIRYSISTPVTGMYNLSERVIGDMKQDKFGASSVISMLRGKGVKAEEIKWLGLEDFLKGKKSVTKQELLDYIRANDLVIEETTLSNNADSYYNELTGERYRSYEDAVNSAFAAAEEHGISPDDFKPRRSREEYIQQGGGLLSSIYVYDQANNKLIGLVKPEAATSPAWQQYSTRGGTNYREILFKMPGSDYTNGASKTHWRDEAPGVMAHARVQDFDTTSGDTVLFVDEIQSDWHNAGQQKGYMPKGQERAIAQAVQNAENRARQKVNELKDINHEIKAWLDQFDVDRVNPDDRDELAKNPALQTLLQKTGEADYPYGSWGGPSLHRWNLLKALTGDLAHPVDRKVFKSEDAVWDELQTVLHDVALSEDEVGVLEALVTRRAEFDKNYASIADEYKTIAAESATLQQTNVPDAPFAESYTDFVLKRMLREAAENGYDGLAWTTSEMQMDRWNPSRELNEKGVPKFQEAYRNIYDRQATKFLNKFGKKFGARVGQTEINSDGETITVPYLPITDEMRESIRTQGLPRFSLSQPIETTPKLVAIHNMGESSLRSIIRSGGMPTMSTAVVRAGMPHTDFGDISLIVPRETVDPEANPKNALFGGDAWTPTISALLGQTQVGYHVDTPAFNAVVKDLVALCDGDPDAEDLVQEIAYTAQHFGVERAIQDYVTGTITLEPELAQLFMRAQGEGRDESGFGAAVNAARSDMDLQAYIRDTMGWWNPDNPVGSGMIADLAEEVDEAVGTSFLADVENGDYDDFKAFCEKVVSGSNRVATKSGVAEWLRGVFSEAVSPTPDTIKLPKRFGGGEIPYNNENLAKLMYEAFPRRQTVGAEEIYFDEGIDENLSAFQSAAVPEFKSVEEARQLSGRMENDAELFRERIEQLRMKLMMAEDEIRRYARRMNVSDLRQMLAEMVELKTTDEVKREFFKKGVVLPESAAQRVLDANKAFAAVSQKYFEAKAERAVGIDELAKGLLVVPDNLDPALLEEASKVFPSLVTYKAGDDASRYAAVNGPVGQGLRFSISEPLSDQLDYALDRNNHDLNNDAVYFGETDELYSAVGFSRGPLLMWSTHVNQANLDKHGTNPHAHGVTKEQFMALPDELAHPVMIFDPAPTKNSTAQNVVAVVTGLLDVDGTPLVAYLRDNGDFQKLDLELTGATAQQRDEANAISTVFGHGEGPHSMIQPTPENAGYVDPTSFTHLMIDAKARDAVLYVNHNRLYALEGKIKEYEKEKRPAQERQNRSLTDAGALPKRIRTGNEVPQSLYALPSGVIIHKSGNLVKEDGTPRFKPSERKADEPTRRYSVTQDQFDNDEEFRAFYRDLFGGLGLTERAHAETQADNSPPEREISLVRSNTLDHFFTATEKQMDELKKEEFDYDRVTEMQSMSAARERLDADYDGEKDYLEKHSFANGTDLDTAMGILSVELANARETGDYTDAVDWAHTIRANGTAAGQLVQAFAKYSRTPEGVLINAIETLEESDLDPARQDEIIERIFEFSRTLHDIQRGDEAGRDDLIDLILEQAEMRNTKVSKTTLKNLSSGKITWLYDLAIAQMDQIARDYIKPSFAKSLATFQTISHLFNPRTASRNIGSNTAFNPLAAIGNNMAIIPDAIASIFTGNRYVGFDRWIFSKATWKGMKEGGAKAQVEVALDVQPEPTQRDKYGTARRTWKMTSGRAARLGSTIEKMMGYELNWTDEFHKGGIKAEILRGLTPMVQNGVITKELAEQWAEMEALYRAFQDDTYVGGLLAILKNGMNTIGIGHTGRKIGPLEIKEFGVGDLVQKYTQVPGALFTRAVEFSPVGYAKCLYLMAKMASSIKESKTTAAKYDALQARADVDQKDALVARAFRAKTAAETAQMQAATAQRMFALAVGRATTGTGLLAMLAAAALKGILRRADDEDDPNVKAQNLSEGITGTQLNTSALARWANGDSTEYMEGDHLMSVDWIEPINGLMTMSALIAKDAEDDETFMERAKNYSTNSLEGLYLAFSDLPTMQTLKTIQDTVNYYDEEDSITGSKIGDIAIEVGRGSLTGFIPSPVRQIAQATDPVQRDTYTSDSVLQQTWDQIRNSIPGLRQQLPAKLDTLGNERKQESGLLGVLNATLLPGNIRTYKQSEYSKEMYEVYKATGDSSFYPGKSAPYKVSFTIDGENTQFKLDAEQRVQYQQTRGATMYALLKDMHNDPVWKAATPEERAEMLSMAKNLATYAANQQIASANGKTYTNNEYEKTNGALDMGYTVASWQNIRSIMAGVTGEDADGDGKTDDGSKKSEALQNLLNLDLTDEQKKYWYDGSTYAEDTDKLGEAMAAGMSADDWFNAKIALYNAHGTDKDGDGKTDSGSVQADAIRILMSMNISPEQRQLLFLQMYPTSTKKANSTNWG